ncbi:trans-aconitate 2-methyltransferase [Nocardioides sp. SYSU D00038]|uniref:class I SAM-dependent methyltransferase n=1 Tax=Nocardioides sp. SYSU D00038 TaxID=2812554 RepID=UPI0019670283|nr:class I SAM-dependent methyltransferase [Nocardioides sp. SYSU D00038]
MTTQLDAPALDLERVQEFAMKVAVDRAIAYNGVLAHLGDRLGLWRSLASVERTTSAQLAQRSGLAERYVREWLATQAAIGYLTYDPATTTFALPAEHAMVLADDDSPAAGVAGFEVITAVYASVDRLAHAYATGDGVPWHDHDPRLFAGVDRFFRTLYRNSLFSEWLPAVTGLMERLESGIRVIDVGCGLGSAVVMMAERFPRSTFVGIDSHAESVRRATEAAEAAGVGDRVRFEVSDAATFTGSYDLVCFFDSVHDLGDPVGALAHCRGRLAEGGQVFAVEPFATDRLEDSLDSPVTLTYYAASSALCVPHSISDGGAALGAQAGPARLTAAFVDAGFATARVAAETPFNLVIEARA